MTDLENKIVELKEFISKYHTHDFLKHVAFVLTQIGERQTSDVFQHLQSPHMQLFYLANLRLHGPLEGDQLSMTAEDWEHITELLKEIENDYVLTTGFKVTPEEISESLRQKTSVTMPTFMNYFFNGPLSYVEQLIERIERTFHKYDDDIREDLGLSVSDFINVYDFLVKEHNDRFNSYLKTIDNEKWQEFTSSMIENGIEDPREWNDHLPEHFREAMQFYSNPGKSFELNLDSTINDFNKEKLNVFLQHFSCVNNPDKSIQYYCSNNELLIKPLYKVDDKNYLIFHQNQLLTSIYNFLLNHLLSKFGDKVYKERDDLLEEKVRELFGEFMIGKKHMIFDGYEVIPNHEQDILLLYDNNAIIIEIKAGKIREPMRDVEKAFEKIEKDFKKTIQYAYSQCLRVEDFFYNEEPFDVILKDGTKVEINPSNYQNIFSIIVTLDRFGPVQTDLGLLLEKNNEFPYPWSVNVDDLESFLLLLSKTKGSSRQKELKVFLSNRELLHERVLCFDELDLCCFFISQPAFFIQQCHEFDKTIAVWPDFTNVIEKVYFGPGGLGFKNERYLQEKNDPSVAFLAMPK